MKPEFKRMIENLQKKLHQGEHKQSKCTKIVSVLDGNLSVKNASKLSAKYSEDKIWKTKQVQNILVILKNIFNQLKTSYKNLTLKRTPIKLPYRKF